MSRGFVEILAGIFWPWILGLKKGAQCRGLQVPPPFSLTSTELLKLN